MRQLELPCGCRSFLRAEAVRSQPPDSSSPPLAARMYTPAPVARPSAVGICSARLRGLAATVQRDAIPAPAGADTETGHLTEPKSVRLARRDTPVTAMLLRRRRRGAMAEGNFRCSLLDPPPQIVVLRRQCTSAVRAATPDRRPGSRSRPPATPPSVIAAAAIGLVAVTAISFALSAPHRSRRSPCRLVRPVRAGRRPYRSRSGVTPRARSHESSSRR